MSLTFCPGLCINNSVKNVTPATLHSLKLLRVVGYVLAIIGWRNVIFYIIHR